MNSDDPRKGPAYRKDIDGLRAVAVLAVLGFHAFPDQVPGGFVGVDIFFVISGFLISSILLRGLREGSFTIIGFYVRRIVRIFPALALVLLFCLALGSLCLLPEEYRKVAKHVIAGAGFLSNITCWRESGYFDGIGITKPLLHLWSLGIEEQFYLFWPLLLWAAWKWRLKVSGVLTAVIAGSFLLGLYWTRVAPVAAFYAPFSRVWELAAGAALAAWTARREAEGTPIVKSAFYARAGSVLGAALLVAAIFGLNARVPFPGWLALVPVAGAFLLLAAGEDAWLNRLLLCNPVMSGIGILSYPLYLWHWPLLSFAFIIGRSPPTVGLRWGLLALAFLLSWLTYRFVEVPLRFGRLDKHRSAKALLAVVALIALAGLLVKLGKGFPGRFDDSYDRIVEMSKDWSYPPREMRPRTVMGVAVDAVGGDGPQTLFIGDSNMQQYAPRICELLRDNTGPRRGALFLTVQGGLPIDGTWRDDTGEKTDIAPMLRLAESPDIDRIVIGAAWPGYFTSGDLSSYGLFTQAVYRVGDLPLRQPPGADAAFARLEEMVALLVSRKKKVTLILGIPSGHEFAKGQAGLQSRSILLIRGELKFSASVPRTVVEERNHFTDQRVRNVARATGAELIEPLDYLCPNGICPTSGHKDQGHLRASYVRTSVTYLDSTVKD